MKTIVLQGELQKFDNMYQATSNFDQDRLPYEVETRVYVVDTYNYEFDDTPENWEDEKFISESEIQGRVYTLQGFQEAFNLEEINSSIDVIRIINVPI